MNTEKVKAKANELSKLCLSDPKTFADEYNKAYDSGEFDETERDLLLPLCDTYTSVRMGTMSRDEAKQKQHRLFHTHKTAAENEVSTI